MIWLEKFTDDSPMPFGQYKGTKLGQMPAQYLLFLYRNNRAGRLADYIKEHMEELLKKEKKQPKIKNRRR